MALLQKLSRYKKHCIWMVGFLVLITISWFVWTWLIPQKPRAVIFPLDGSSFVTFTPDSKVLITREPQWYSPSGPGPVSMFAMRPRPSRIQVWDSRDGALLHTFGEVWADTQQIIPTPDSLRLIGWVSGDPEKSPDFVESCDLLTGENSKRVALAAKEHSFVGLEFSPDNKWLIVSPTSGVMYQCWLWRIGSDNLVRFDRSGPTITFSENGDRVAVSEPDARTFSVKAWALDDLTKPVKEYSWPAEEGIVFPGASAAATYHVEDSKIAKANLWDLASGQLLATFPVSHRQSHIHFLNFPAGNQILTNYVEHTASTAIWDVNGQPSLTSVFDGWRIATSKDRNWMLQSEETGVQLVDLRSGHDFSLTHLKDTRTSSNGADGRFSPDSRFVAITGIRQHVKVNPEFKWLCSFLSLKADDESEVVARLWTVDTAAEVARFVDCNEALFSPDSKTLATLQEDGSVQLWDIPARSPIWQILVSACFLWLALLLSSWAWSRLCRKQGVA
jgi:WD40 repeat protein